jgi:hypothetical protein
MAAQEEEKLLPTASQNWADNSAEFFSILNCHFKTKKLTK